MARAPKNEQNNVNLTRDTLLGLGYTAENGLDINPQSSKDEMIVEMLADASKTGKVSKTTGKIGKGHPDFIVTSASDPDVVVVIECKASTADHESPERKDISGKAVDGALHYARKLSRRYHVIAIASSGETEDVFKVSTFIHRKGLKEAEELKTRSGVVISTLLPWAELKDAFTYDPSLKQMRQDELMAYAGDLHEYLRDHGIGLTEKPLLVAGTLMALQSKKFRSNYMVMEDTVENHAAELMGAWFAAITAVVNASKIPDDKRERLINAFSNLAGEDALTRPTKANKQGPMLKVIKDLAEKVIPLMAVFNEYDLVGQFYGEFLSYSGAEKKDKGIVLTPPHITDLMCDLAGVARDEGSNNDIVVDLCTGTGGFLIAAMKKMLDKCVTEAERMDVKANRLIGVEKDQTMYALAAANMLLRGDGRANLYLDDSLEPNVIADEPGVIDKIKAHPAGRPTVGLINPPYSLKTANKTELDFILKMLDVLDKKGVGVAIVPMSCAIGNKTGYAELKARILKEHRLEAVMTMPGELFHPVGTNTCIMVFTAHVPHGNAQTWFANWTDDGFIKTKNKGRIPKNNDAGVWNAVKERWLEAYDTTAVEDGFSLKAKVSAKHEWLFDAHVKTDYSGLTREELEKVVKDYVLFSLAKDGVR